MAHRNHWPTGGATWFSIVVVLSVLLSACASASRPDAGSRDPSDARTQSGGATAQSAPKTLQIALQGFQEPNGGIVQYGSTGTGGFDPLEHFLIFHASLTVYDQQGRLIPRLAEKIPSVADGDWKVLPDGRMEVTWRLKPNLTWHDGVPLSAADFVLGAQISKDPDVPASKPIWAPLVTEVTALDDRTLIVSWSETTFLAEGTGAGDIPALPRHLIGQLYQAPDRTVFLNSPYWTTEFVGLGPYKLTTWQRGSFIEAQAFDGYVLGRPKIDRIVIRYVGDVNAIIAGVLGGDVDVVPMGSPLDSSQVVTIHDFWGADGGFARVVPFGIRSVWLQFRDPSAPWARDVRVRRAMVHSTDRQEMSEALQSGTAPVADTFIPPESSAYRVLEAQGFNRHPFDLTRARQLMGEAGWNRGADGTFRDQGGQPLTVEIAATGQGSNVQEIETIASQWQVAGFTANPVPIPPQAANLDERRATVRGGFLWPWTPSLTAPQNIVTSQAPTERTSWKGRNYGSYSNPAYDALYERYTTTIEPTARDRLVADLMRLVAEEVPLVPIYFYGTGVIARKGVSGPGMLTPLQTASAWNIESWEIR